MRRRPWSFSAPGPRRHRGRPGRAGRSAGVPTPPRGSRKSTSAPSPDTRGSTGGGVTRPGRRRPRTPGTRGPGPGARTAPRASPRRAGAWTRRRRGRHHRPPNPRGAGRAGGTAPRRPESPGSARRRSRRRGGAGSGRSATLPRPRRRLRRPGAPMRGRSSGAMSLLRAPGPAQSLGVLSAPLRPAGPCRQSGTLELQRVGNCGHVFDGASRPLDSLSDTP